MFIEIHLYLRVSKWNLIFWRPPETKIYPKKVTKNHLDTKWQIGRGMYGWNGFYR